MDKDWILIEIERIWQSSACADSETMVKLYLNFLDKFRYAHFQIGDDSVPNRLVATDVDSATDAVKELNVSPPTPATSISEASPQKDKGGGHDHEEDDDQEEDQEARNKELQRIHEELQKADNRWHVSCIKGLCSIIL